MAAKYDHKSVEKKWQKRWADDNAFAASDSSDKEKLYVLDMFPYPSGAGLHVGHVEGYTATDIYSRFKRMQGYNVLHPMGWDAFGLPAENYAIKTGIPPAKTTEDAIAMFRTQIQSLGLSYDWSREVGAHRPDYYKWTQWFFLFLYKNGLAEKRMAKVNWCPKDQTVLANEQTVSETGEKGVCFRCGTKVVQKDLEQWFFKITQYADQLADDLDQVDWPESTKVAQRNWIGRSEGAEIDFAVAGEQGITEAAFASNNQGKLKRMQTLFKAGGLAITLKTPIDIGVENFDVVEDGATLMENAEKKARSLAGKANIPVFADDSGFFINGTKIDPVTVKRNALAGLDEKSLTVEEIAKKMQDYYAEIASKQGGRVDAEWHNALCLILPDGSARKVETIRPVILTNESRGNVDPYLPLRGLYISKATNKYVLEQTEVEELEELQPITDGLKKIFTPLIKVFTTRPDTLFGATYLVLAPEHALVEALSQKLENGDEVRKYVAAAKNKTDLERQEEAKDKTGVELRGVRAINPATGEEIPIYVADYVLGGYGTGAIMAVPAHDERDYQFAKKFGLPIREVIEPTYEQTTEPGKIREGEPFDQREAIIAIVKHWQEEKYIALKWKQVAWGTFITGGIEAGQTPETAAKAELEEEVGYTDAKFIKDFGVVHGKFYHVPKKTNRNAHAHVVYLELQSDARKEVAQNEQAIHEVLWLTADELKKFLTPATHQHGLRWLLGEQGIHTDYGTLANSGEFNRLESEEAKRKIVEKVGGKMVKTYRLRDWLISRQRYWGAPIPVVYDPEGKPHPIPEEHLPWLLPTDVEFSPKGTSPLGQSKELLERTEKIFGAGWKPEIDTMDTFVCSSWYYFRFADPRNESEFASKEMLKKWLPVDLYVGGAEHTVLHLLYSRFVAKALRDHGYVEFSEPFLKLRHQGLIGGEDGRKMSKSFGNVVNPMDIIETYGADTLRLYEMFMGPLETHKPWSSQNIIGVRRFLERVWKLSEKIEDLDLRSPDIEALLHQTIKKVGEDLEALKMNTAISSLMILLNELETLPNVPKAAYGMFLALLAPLAPHIANELAEKAGADISAWPSYDDAKLASATVVVAVQVNGKTRGTVELAPGAGEEEALAAARSEAGAAKWLALGKEVKAVYVPGKVISFVIQQV
jgi:leucyl-tRNA synthetase